MSRVKKVENCLQPHRKILVWICVAVLALLPFLHVNSGVEFTDTGYSLGNYENFAKADGTWALATFLSNITGWLMTKLPFGHTMLGMQVYCNAVLSIILVAVFIQLIKYLPIQYVFAGEVLAWALCWCPRVILYNYMTYLFFAVGCLLLLKAFETEKKRYFFLAGVVLGLSVFVRFSNLVQAALIVVVFYQAVLKKESWKNIWKKVGICVGGYFTALFIVIACIGIFYGPSEYFTMIQSLFSMESTESSYSLISMIKAPLQAVWEQARFLWIFPVAVGIATLVYRFCKNKALRFLCSGLVLTGTMGLVLVFYKMGIFWRNYNDYHCFKVWAVAFVLYTLGMAVYVMVSRKADILDKTLACMVIVIVLVTPLGSNNAMYPVYNNLFLVAPFGFSMGSKYIFQVQKEILWPTKLALCVLTLVLMIQSLLFGWTFTFRDAGFTTGIDTTITENRVLRGMRTTEERAGVIEELSAYVYEKELVGEAVLLYGEIPFAVYALEMPSALSSSWADLNTVLSVDAMEKEMNAMEEPPVVIVAVDYYEDLLKTPNTDNEKALLISDYIQDNSYEEAFRNEKFVVYLPLRLQ